MGHYYVVGGLLAVCSACSVLIDAEPQQCEVDDDCTVRGGDFSSSECVDGYCSMVEEDIRPAVGSCSKDPDCDVSEACVEKKCESRWQCIDDAPASAADGPIQASLLVSNFGEPMPNVPARACRSADPNCSSPVAEVTSDATGRLNLSLPDGFTGYLEVVVEPFFPVLYYFPSPLLSDTPLPALSLTPREVIQGLGLAVGAQPDPERGHILMSVTGCEGPAPGVNLSAPKADDETIPYYVLDGIPSADLDATTAAGSGGFLNFPPGNAVVKLASGKAGELVSLSLTVRQGFITSVSFNPASVTQEAP